ncbi:uncharacterized protein A1O9_08929 [Exophiala aquamarina CBS 119918]|uniref:Multicopper oxidase n=1 Tax=Exophiala aquamarina CBS 119918 TaxID=1182545 RepID=A0A072PIG4_9EURO|nr:uncharacterized protein A1O9_08929 [Exophiala aquamarina CBS 119918]KEF55275.1 hypothetical protein A1O9_08929 [Exophiala aquamarina CBS 119918]
MAFTRLTKALTALSFALSSFQLVTASSDTYNSACGPSTGHIPFTIDVTWGPTDSSKAFSRNAFLINGTLPGPPLHLKVGDVVDFTVINHTPDVTGVHFHGIRQLSTPWADGVPGVSQTVIKSQTTYTYTWEADASGTYFYHAHYKGQMMDGLYGAIIISPADTADTPFGQIGDAQQVKAAADKVTPVFASDWNRFTFDEFFQIEQEANIDWACTDSITLNGFGSQLCPSLDFLTANAAPPAIKILNGTALTAKGCIPPSNPVIQGQFQRNLAALPPGAYDVCTPFTGQNFTLQVDPKDGWAAMSFISPASFAIFTVAIDNHKLYVYEYNGNYIQPQVVDKLTLANGDRISFMVKLDQTPADYIIRVANAGINQVVSGFGILAYKGGDDFISTQGVINYGGVNTTTVTSFAPGRAAPYPPVAVSSHADQTFVLDILKDPAQPTEAWAWTLSGIQAYDESRDDAVPPLLFQDPSAIPNSDLILKTKFNQWIDLIIKVEGPVAQPHPIHKHANKFFAIGAGTGAFNFTTVAAAQAGGMQFNLQNPPFLDGFTSIPAEGTGSWMVFRYQADTPGAWLLHCHIQTHFSGGMGVAILDAIDNFPKVPTDLGSTCSGTGKSTDNGSDSGSGSGSGSGSDSGSGSGSGSGSSSGSGSGSDSGTGSGSGSGSGSTTTASGSTGTRPATIATFTGAASSERPMVWSVSLGLLAFVLALTS